MFSFISNVHPVYNIISKQISCKKIFVVLHKTKFFNNEKFANYGNCTFLDLEECYLVPLKKLYFEKDFHFQCLVVTTLTSLLRNFVALEWPRLNKEREITR